MTRKEILSIAFEAGFSVRGETIRTIHSSGAWVDINDKLAKFAELVAIRAVAAERERLCALIKAADDKASDGDYMLDSDDCISVIQGTWNHEHN